METLSFSKKNTNFIKGIAIITLIVHHLTGQNPGVPVNIHASTVLSIVGTEAKVCVALFMILSGYGLFISYQSKQNNIAKYVYNHIVKLLFNFWLMFVFCWLLYMLLGNKFANIYGTGMKSVLYFIKDFFGMHNFIIETPSINGSFWFMEAVILCYLLFPLFYQVMKNKYLQYALLILTYVPWVVYMIHGQSAYGWHTDRELYYFFSFVVGMYLAKNDILNYLLRKMNQYKVAGFIISLVSLMITFVLRIYICLPVDPVFAVSIIAFLISCIVIFPNNILSDWIEKFGIYSSDIYMFHLSLLILINFIPIINIKVKLFAFILLCYCIGAGINGLKKCINYHKLAMLITWK